MGAPHDLRAANVVGLKNKKLSRNPAQHSTFRFRENFVLYGALVANVGIAIAKFVAAGITGSLAMLTEGVH